MTYHERLTVIDALKAERREWMGRQTVFYRTRSLVLGLCRDIPSDEQNCLLKCLALNGQDIASRIADIDAELTKVQNINWSTSR